MGVAASLNSSAEPIGGGGMSAGSNCQKHLFTLQLCNHFIMKSCPLLSHSEIIECICPHTSVHVGIRCDHTRLREMNAIWSV